MLGGSPGTFLRVTDGGSTVLDAVERGEPVAGSTLVDRLVATGIAHPEPGSPRPAGDVTVVVPVFARTRDQVTRLQRLVDSLAPLRVIVVDDASPVAVDVGCHRMIRHESNGGPAAARNTGLRVVDTDVVAFVDADVSVTSADILRLTGHLADEAVAFVAPRVSTPDGRSATSQYESLRSPLDMGPHAARVRRGSMVPYLPSAVLVGRTADAAAGFDEGMTWGEDVEFVWRNGSDTRLFLYDPDVVCLHEPRPTVAAMLAQRWNYGRSAAAIDARIPMSVSPVRSHVAHVLPLSLLLAQQPGWAFISLMVSIDWTWFALRGMGLRPRDRLAVARVAVFSSSRSVARAVTREWWPAFGVAAVFSEYATFALMLPLAVTVLVDIVRLRPSNLAVFTVLRVADNLVYGLGVWAGAVAHRSVRCLLPALSVRRSARAA